MSQDQIEEKNREIQDAKSNKPLIALLKNPLGYYLYDTGTNLVLKVEKPLYEEISNIMKTGIIDSVSPQYEDILRLKENGFLSDRRVKSIEHYYNETLEDILNNNCEYLILQVTQNCNLRCSYCAFTNPDNNHRKHDQRRMTFETAKKAIDFYKSKTGTQKDIAIGFYGGEPLLEIELISRCIEYANKVFNGREIRFNITTNGTLLNDKNMDIVVKNNIHILISLDGDKESHDKNRRFANSDKGSFDIILENLEKMIEKYPNFYRENVRFNVVMDQSNDFKCIDKFFDNTDFFTPTAIRANFIDMRNLKFEDNMNPLFLQDYMYNKFILYLYLLGRINEKNVSILVDSSKVEMNIIELYANKLKLLPTMGHPGGPCIPGRSKLFVSIDGIFYPCEKANENDVDLIIGDISRGYNINNIKTILNIGCITSDECKQCWMFRLCSLCAISSENGRINKQIKLERCKGIKNGILHNLNDYIILRHYGYEFKGELH